MDIADDGIGLQLYEELVNHPELLNKTQKALLERPNVSGLDYMKPYAEISTSFTAAAQPLEEPDADSKPPQELQDIAAIPKYAEVNAASPEIEDHDNDCGKAATTQAGMTSSSTERPPSTCAVNRRAMKECLLVIFQWKGRSEALHVLREKGADACRGAVWAHQLQAETFPLPALARRHKCVQRDGWRGLARMLHLKDGGACSWVCDAAEGRVLRENGASKRGSRMRMLSVGVALEMLETSFVERQGDLAALKAALATAQPLSSAETVEKYQQHLAQQKENDGQRRRPEQLEQAPLLAKGKPAALNRDDVEQQNDERKRCAAENALGAGQLRRQAQGGIEAACSEDSVPLIKLRHKRQQQQQQPPPRGSVPGSAAPMEGSDDLAGRFENRHQQVVHGDAAEGVAAMEDSGKAPLTRSAALATVSTLLGHLASPPRTSGREPAAPAGLPGLAGAAQRAPTRRNAPRPSPAQLQAADAGQAPVHVDAADRDQGTGRPQYAEAILSIPRKLGRKAKRSMQVDPASLGPQRKHGKTCADTKEQEFSGRAAGQPDMPDGASTQAPAAAEQPQDKQARAAAAFQAHFEERKASLLKLQAAFIQESTAHTKPLMAKIRAQQVKLTRLQQQRANMHKALQRDKEKLEDLQQRLTGMTSKYGIVLRQLKERGG